MALASHQWTCGDPKCPICLPVGQAPPEPKPKKEYELRFDTEPIVGWRVWKIRKQDPVLSEMLPEIIGAIELGDVSPLRDAMRYHLCPLATGQTPWPASKRFEAECHSSAGYYTPPHLLYTAPSSYGNLPARTLATHEAPHVDCMCGAWAVREGELDTAMKQYNGIKNDAFAWGEVHLWGHVVEAEKGYRARFAYPKNLTLVNGTDEMEEDLALLYNVPVSRGGWKKSWNRPPEEDPWERALTAQMKLLQGYYPMPPKTPKPKPKRSRWF